MFYKSYQLIKLLFSSQLKNDYEYYMNVADIYSQFQRKFPGMIGVEVTTKKFGTLSSPSTPEQCKNVYVIHVRYNKYDSMINHYDGDNGDLLVF
jgi:antibiotic biosynthesis monooxygenase (ABM) superfamily enzyme